MPMSEQEIEQLRVGDVVRRDVVGTERIVREVCRKPFFRTGPEYTYMVCVAIIRCSWTTRA